MSELNDLVRKLGGLQIPKDFSEVHNVRDLFAVVEAGDIIRKYFVEYKEEFIKSFFMTADEVLEYIPSVTGWKVCKGYETLFDLPTQMVSIYSESVVEKARAEGKGDQFDQQEQRAQTKLAEYEGVLGVKIKEEKVDKWGETRTLITRSLKNCKTLSDKLRYISRDKAVFLVDTKNKRIEVNWLLLPEKKIHIPSKYEGVKGWDMTAIDTEGVAFHTNDYNSRELERTGTQIDSDTQVITQACELRTAYSKYIPRDSSWYSGRRTHEYETVRRSMYIEHSFCMKSNLYLGVKVSGHKDALEIGLGMTYWG